MQYLSGILPQKPGIGIHGTAWVRDIDITPYFGASFLGLYRHSA
jgi:hypothetical protein